MAEGRWIGLRVTDIEKIIADIIDSTLDAAEEDVDNPYRVDVEYMAKAIVADLQLERQQMDFPDRPEYKDLGVTMMRDPDVKYVPNVRYVTPWMAEEPK